MKKLPPLTELRAFEAAARHLSFKMAASELGVTPTAISHQIRLLERYCGRPLFRRRPRPLVLTWAGAELFPVVRDGLDQFAETLATVRRGSAVGHLRVTATNAFAARWLVPRLPLWRAEHPGLRLEIVGTDDVLDLKSGSVDVAIRYALRQPTEVEAHELLRDRYHVVASPKLLGQRRRTRPMTPKQISTLPLIGCDWPPTDPHAPTWRRWAAAARTTDRDVPELDDLVAVSFREELHAIEAVIAGQGAAILSDVVVGPELSNGTLVRLSELTLPGYGFYIAYRRDHPKLNSIRAFTQWAQAMI